MPDFGSLDTANHPFTIPAIAPLYPPPPWKLDDARLFMMTFEIEKRHAIQWLPGSLTRPNPAYAHLQIAHYPSTPVGPFTVAHQFLMSRLRVLPRAFPFQTVVDNADALPALRETWGFPAKLGKVALTREKETITGTVERPAGKVLAKVVMTQIRPMGPGELRYDPMLNLRLTSRAQEERAHEYAQLVQIDPSYMIKESYRGEGTVTYPKKSKDDPWHLLEPVNFIGITYGVCDTEMPWARFLEEFPQG